MTNRVSRRALGIGFAVSSMRVLGANSRIRVGLIGAGVRSQALGTALLARNDAEIVCVCDVYKSRARRTCTDIKLNAPLVQNYREVLDRKDIDAVVIAVPDHWHVPILLDAISAGKDAYVEKPMTFRMEEGPQVVKAVRESKRVVQVGTQQKSLAIFIEAKERFIDTGKIGKVSLVRTWWIANPGYSPANNPHRRPPKNFVYDPADFDWNGFLGPAPRRPFTPDRYWGWMKYADYSTGQPGGLMVHHLDAVHWYLGLTAPSAVVAAGGMYAFPKDRDMPDTISVLAEYPQKVLVTFDAAQSSIGGADIEFHGSGGILNVFRGRYTFRPAGVPADKAIQVTAKPDGELEIGPHMDNFLAAMRSRSQPNGDVVHSHYLAAVCHMANMSWARQNRIVWDRSWDVPRL